MNTFEKMEKDPTQWVIKEMTGIVNTRFGSVKVVQVIDDTGKLLYEGIIFAEAQGVINVIVDIDDPENPKIAFVTQVRHAVIDSEYLNSIWTNGVPDIFDPEIKKHMGVLVTELPRGFVPGKDIVSEAEEETQRKVEFVADIGNVNANTANTATSPKVIVAKATKLPSGRIQDSDEKIRQVLWLTPKEILEQADFCGFTLACLGKFRAWCLLNSEPLWKSVGERL